jgi:hypothetical protein
MNTTTMMLAGHTCPEVQPLPPRPTDLDNDRSVFCAASEYWWTCGTALKLRHQSYGGNQITLTHEQCNSLITLPAGEQYRIKYELAITNQFLRPLTVMLRLSCGNKILLEQPLFDNFDINDRTADSVFSNHEYFTDHADFTDNGELVFVTPRGSTPCTLGIWLQTPAKLSVKMGKIIISRYSLLT